MHQLVFGFRFLFYDGAIHLIYAKKIPSGIMDAGNIYRPTVFRLTIAIGIQFYCIYDTVVIGIDPFIVHVPFAIAIEIDIYPRQIAVFYTYLLFCWVVIIFIGLIGMKNQLIPFIERPTGGTPRRPRWAGGHTPGFSYTYLKPPFFFGGKRA